MPDRINPQLVLQDHFKQLKANLRAEIELLKAPLVDRAAYIAKLITDHGISPLKLGITETASSAKKKIPKRFMADRWTEEVDEVIVNIHYEGDKILFNCKPIGYTKVWPKHRHRLYANIITVYLELPEPDAELFDRELTSFKTEISKNFERINNQVEFFNEELNDYIEQLLKTKEAQFQQQATFHQKIGLKINPRSAEFLTPTAVRRKIVPQPSAERNNGKTHIVLESQVYNDIRQVLYYVGQAMERKPSLYQGKREEHLRDIFLLFLETRYEATTGSGEAFNKKGKTDILLKYAPDGSNLFVAECKIWKGQKELFKAIDQLLSYLTWRDTKTALIIFVPLVDMTSALEVVTHFINRHPQFKSFVGATHATSFAYEMALPVDPGSSVWMEFMLFHFPKDKPQ